VAGRGRCFRRATSPTTGHAVTGLRRPPTVRRPCTFLFEVTPSVYVIIGKSFWIIGPKQNRQTRPNLIPYHIISPAHASPSASAAEAEGSRLDGILLHPPPPVLPPPSSAGRRRAQIDPDLELVPSSDGKAKLGFAFLDTPFYLIAARSHSLLPKLWEFNWTLSPQARRRSCATILVLVSCCMTARVRCAAACWAGISVVRWFLGSFGRSLAYTPCSFLKSAVCIAGCHEEVGIDRPRREGARQIVPRPNDSGKARQSNHTLRFFRSSDLACLECYCSEIVWYSCDDISSFLLPLF
jgi:hypothetical protein